VRLNLVKIVITGNEIMQGQVIDTNSSYISKRLSSLGYDISEKISIGDKPAEIKNILRQYLKGKTKIIIFIGGLGPTLDDITKESVAEELKISFYKDNSIVKDLKIYFKKRGYPITPIIEKQAKIPKGAVILKNSVGTAPGFIIKRSRRLIILLPGPSDEFINIVEKKVLPYLKSNSFLKDKIEHKLIRTIGIGESWIQEKLGDIIKNKNIGFVAHPGAVDIKLTFKEKDRAEYNKMLRKIKNLFKDYIYTIGDRNLEEVLGSRLLKKKKSLSIAESCTGGLIANRITDVSGSSVYFKMGVVCYSNESKIKILNVNKKSLSRYGAVSEIVAGEMAEGLRTISGADISISITGIAGPGGGSKEKPVGLVYIGLVSNNKKEIKKFLFSGDRKKIKYKISQAALEMARQSLR
jgi:nicotinamide-nucleotide amidase